MVPHRPQEPVLWRWALPCLTLLVTLLVPADVAVGSATPAASEPAAATIDPEQDAHIERLLSKGRIVRSARTRLGITDPLRVWVEDQGETISGCFKYIDLQTLGITRARDGEVDVNFTDRHIYDQAAYRLDRELGLHLVPVAVPRKVRGLRGTLVHWLDDVVDETYRLERSLPPRVIAQINTHKRTMSVFDALIDNVDRNAGNLLYTPGNWNLYLIDHTRAFRPEKKLRESFLARPIALSRPFYDRLQELNEADLWVTLKGLLSKIQIRTLLDRRDLIVEKVERERGLRGDDAVFLTTPGTDPVGAASENHRSAADEPATP